MEQLRHLADEFTESCPDGEEKIPQGDSREVVFVTLQESYDSLTGTVNERCEILQQHIKLWHNYNELKEAVSAVIDDVQGSVDKLQERSRDPTVPPTNIVDSANVCVHVHVCVLYIAIFGGAKYIRMHYIEKFGGENIDGQHLRHQICLI